MIPSLVVTELREALVEYLATTFALSDDETRDAFLSSSPRRVTGSSGGRICRCVRRFNT